MRGGAQGQDSPLDGGVSILHDENAQLPHHFTALGTAATTWTSAMPASLQHWLPDPGQEPGTWQVTLSAAKSTKNSSSPRGHYHVLLLQGIYEAVAIGDTELYVSSKVFYPQMFFVLPPLFSFVTLASTCAHSAGRAI